VSGGTGWGGAPWGGGAWAGGGAPFALFFATADRENVVRLEFDAPVYWSGLGDLFDASRVDLFSITPVVNTVGLDGQPARAVTPSQVIRPTDVDPAIESYFLDIVIDRILSPFPTQYVITCSGLATDAAGTALLDPTQASYAFAGCAMELVSPSFHLAERGGDFANPQTLFAAQAARMVNPTSAPLGTYGADGSGDYAVERGVEAYKARLIRMILAKRGSFQHLPVDRGAGLPSLSKMLATRGRLDQVHGAIEAEVFRDPDTLTARINVLLQTNGVYRVTVLAQMRTGPIVKFGTDLSSG